MISAILRPDKPPEKMSELSFVACLAVAECIRETCGIKPALKWPNDVLVRGKKIAGILVEMMTGPCGTVAVVGIGLNVNQPAFPAELAPEATSVAMEIGNPWDLEEMLVSLATSLFTEYDKYMGSGFEGTLRRWRNHMWGVGAHAEATTGGQRFTGIIRGVDSTGALILEDGSGADHLIHAADRISITT